MWVTYLPTLKWLKGLNSKKVLLLYLRPHKSNGSKKSKMADAISDANVGGKRAAGTFKCRRRQWCHPDSFALFTGPIVAQGKPWKEAVWCEPGAYKYVPDNNTYYLDYLLAI